MIKNQMILRDVGERIKKVRMNLGYTQRDLVDRMNFLSNSSNDDFLTEKQLSRIELGKCTISIDKFFVLCLSLNKTPDFFLINPCSYDLVYKNSDLEINEKLLIEKIKCFDNSDCKNILTYIDFVSFQNGSNAHK